MTHALQDALPCHAELVNIPGFTEQFAARHEVTAMERSVRVVDGVSPDAIVIGDAIAIHRLVERLLGDALDHTPVGGCLTIRSKLMQGHVVLVATCAASGRVTDPALELTISLPIVAA